MLGQWQGMTELSLSEVAQGNKEALACCVERYGSLIWSLASRFCRNPSDAEDAVQDIFIDVWNSASRFDPKRSSERTFIMMIARRRLIDRVRKCYSLKERFTFCDTEAINKLGKQDDVESKDLTRRTQELLKTMPEERRRVLWLSIYEGMSHSEIVNATGIPLGTVKSHVTRGLRIIRDRFLTPESNHTPALREARP